jgi:hypothetical protein
MIRIDEIWLTTQPLDMRAGPEVVIDPIEKLRQVDIHCHFIPRFDEPFDLAHRTMGIAPRSEAMTGF